MAVKSALVWFSTFFAVEPMDSPAVTAELATQTAYRVVASRRTVAPKSDKCANCNGTGKLGDGRVVYTCPACKGTGKACVNGNCKP